MNLLLEELIDELDNHLNQLDFQFLYPIDGLDNYLDVERIWYDG